MRELNICHLYPDVLNLYGDRGNVLCLKKRLEWRGLGCNVTELSIGEHLPLGRFDLFFLRWRLNTAPTACTSPSPSIWTTPR